MHLWGEEKKHALKKYVPLEKLLIRQLISNFADFWRKKNIFMLKNQAFKNISCKESSCVNN